MENFLNISVCRKTELPCTHLFYIVHTNELLPLFKKIKKDGDSYEIPGPSFKGRECTIMFQLTKQKYCHLHSLSLCHTPRLYSCRCFDLYFVFTDCSSPTTRAVESTTFVETFLIILPLYLPLRKSSRTARPTLFLLPEWFPPTSALFSNPIISYTSVWLNIHT